MKGAASRIRHLLTLQQEVSATNASGGRVRSWETVADVWGEVTLGNGQKEWAGGQLEPRLLHRITLRYRPDVTPGMRLVFEGRVFSIHSVGVVDERKALLEIIAEEGAAS